MVIVVASVVVAGRVGIARSCRCRRSSPRRVLLKGGGWLGRSADGLRTRRSRPTLSLSFSEVHVHVLRSVRPQSTRLAGWLADRNGQCRRIPIPFSNLQSCMSIIPVCARAPGWDAHGVWRHGPADRQRIRAAGPKIQEDGRWRGPGRRLRW